MALISCPECSKEVSSNAASCVNCGFPIADQESKGSTAKLTTTQQTSKKLKLHRLLSSWLAVVSALSLFLGKNLNFHVKEVIAGIMICSIVWWITVKVRIWWHHD